MRNPRSPKNQRGFPHSGFGRPCRSGRMWRCHELGRSRRALLPGEIWWKDLELAWIERSPPPESLERICCNISRIFVGHPKLRPKLSCETVVPCGTLWYPVVPCGTLCHAIPRVNDRSKVRLMVWTLSWWQGVPSSNLGSLRKL